MVVLQKGLVITKNFYKPDSAAWHLSPLGSSFLAFSDSAHPPCRAYQPVFRAFSAPSPEKGGYRLHFDKASFLSVLAFPPLGQKYFSTAKFLSILGHERDGAVSCKPVSSSLPGHLFCPPAFIDNGATGMPTS